MGMKEVKGSEGSKGTSTLGSRVPPSVGRNGSKGVKETIGGARRVKGSKGSTGTSILGSRIPTTCGRRGVKGLKGSEGE